MFKILDQRYLFFSISGILVLSGLVILFITGVPFSIDFTGGSLLEVEFTSAQLPQPAEIIELYNAKNITDLRVQTTADNTLVIRSPFLDDDVRADLVRTMQAKYSDDVVVLRYESVGPSIGKEVTTRAAGAVAVSALVVTLYIVLAFRSIPHAFRYGLCAIAAMIHDVGIVMSLVAFGGLFFGWQFDALMLTALLTVIGFSVNDSIVVFDRIRENKNLYRRLDYARLVKHSIIQTLQRSLNTQLMTVEFLLLSLVLFGGVTLRGFSIILLVGLFSGTYSTFFIATPLLVIWENREWRNWFRRKPAGTPA